MARDKAGWWRWRKTSGVVAVMVFGVVVMEVLKEEEVVMIEV